jgi:hypothetical protein
MDAKAFWSFVQLKVVELGKLNSMRLRQYEVNQDEQCFEGQPKDGKGIYISSREIIGVQEAGRVVLAGTRLAAQRIVEQTHEVATAGQIARFKSESETRRLYIAELERKIARRVAVTIEPTDPAPRVAR